MKEVEVSFKGTERIGMSSLGIKIGQYILDSKPRNRIFLHNKSEETAIKN